MQYVSLLSNHAVTGIVQHCRLSMNMDVCFMKSLMCTVLAKCLVLTIYGADIEIKYSQVIQSSLTQCYHVNKEFLVECILKKNARSFVLPTGYLFSRNDVYISCIVKHSTSDTCYFVLTYENEQFCFPGPFNLNSLVKKVSDIYRLDDFSLVFL